VKIIVIKEQVEKEEKEENEVDVSSNSKDELLDRQ